MKKILLISLLYIGQFTFAQNDGQSDLEKLLGKAQKVLSNVELPGSKKETNSEWVVIGWQPNIQQRNTKEITVTINYSDENVEDLQYNTPSEDFEQVKLFKEMTDKGYKFVDIEKTVVNLTGNFFIITQAYFIKYL
tara:strand:- start:177 stop:584 length:408 start_codon:yes stop_codon:yes gene_type:complete